MPLGGARPPLDAAAFVPPALPARVLKLRAVTTFIRQEFALSQATPADRVSRVIDVACAVLTNAAGAVLLAERPAAVPYAGFWEFPGGKFEAGEDAHACLARELQEELGLDAVISEPWLTRVFAYPDKTVRLHFLRVRAYRGEPHGREGQRLAWQFPEAVTVAPLLAANAPVLRALALPALYALSAAQRYGARAFLEKLDAALARGLRLIQVREQALAADALASLAAAVVARAHAHGARVLINGDAALATRVGADGVHLTGAQLRALRQRPDLALCAASCHHAQELAQAARLGCDFVVLSPVLPSASHAGAATLGWPGFAALIQQYPLPVYALGGMRRDALAEARRHGAHGLALLSQAWE